MESKYQISNRIILHGVVSFTAVLIFTTSASAFHSPRQGRFLQRDPGSPPKNSNPTSTYVFTFDLLAIQNQYADGMNLYEYVKSKPIIAVDPSGYSIDHVWPPRHGPGCTQKLLIEWADSGCDECTQSQKRKIKHAISRTLRKIQYARSAIGYIYKGLSDPNEGYPYPYKSKIPHTIRYFKNTITADDFGEIYKILQHFEYNMYEKENRLFLACDNKCVYPTCKGKGFWGGNAYAFTDSGYGEKYQNGKYVHKIHFCTYPADYFKLSSTTQTKVMIHEFAHRYINAQDYQIYISGGKYKGIMDGKRIEPVDIDDLDRVNDILYDWEYNNKFITHADTWAWFLMGF